jgi:hypothetical protein
VPIPPIVVNALVIGGMLHYVYNFPLAAIYYFHYRYWADSVLLWFGRHFNGSIWIEQSNIFFRSIIKDDNAQGIFYSVYYITYGIMLINDMQLNYSCIAAANNE